MSLTKWCNKCILLELIQRLHNWVDKLNLVHMADTKNLVLIYRKKNSYSCLIIYLLPLDMVSDLFLVLHVPDMKTYFSHTENPSSSGLYQLKPCALGIPMSSCIPQVHLHRTSYNQHLLWLALFSSFRLGAA
jgi:hypothetical protein